VFTGEAAVFNVFELVPIKLNRIVEGFMVCFVKAYTAVTAPFRWSMWRSRAAGAIRH
jgi:hypothetical protein